MSVRCEHHQKVLSYRQTLLSRLSFCSRGPLEGIIRVRWWVLPWTIVEPTVHMCYRSITLRAEVTYRLASDAPLSWITKRTLKKQNTKEPTSLSVLFLGVEGWEENVHSLFRHVLPSAPQGPACQRLQVSPVKIQKVFTRERHNFPAALRTVGV